MYIFDEIDETLPLAEKRRYALNRRANKLIEWLNGVEYAQYTDATQSKEKLSRLITLIIYALEESISKDDWKVFLRLFQETRFSIQTIDKPTHTEIQRKTIYDSGVANTIKILEEYRAYVGTARL